MRRKEFIDIILNGISDTFDIYHNYWFNNRKFVIYAYNYKNRDKFSTTESANYGMLSAMSIYSSLIVIILAWMN